MKKFSFRLERLQRLRERVRDQKQVAHAHAIEYQQRVEAQIEQIRSYREQELDSLQAELSQSEISVARAIQRRSFGGVLSNLDGQLDRQLQQVQQVVEVRRNELVVAERDVRVLEKLEERARQRYQQAADRAEVQTLDELAARAENRGLSSPIQRRI